MARDCYMEGGPSHLEVEAEKLRVWASYARGKAKRMLVEMEKTAGREFMNGNSYLGSRANLIQGANFLNWAEYHNTFIKQDGVTTDIWR